jgi:SnoaL-like domain
VNEPLPPEVQDLIDKQQIRDLLMRYSRGADRADWDLVLNCFTDDATDDHGMVKGTAQDLVEYSAKAEPDWRGRMHGLLQQYVEVDGPTTARSPDLRRHVTPVHRPQRRGRGRLQRVSAITEFPSWVGLTITYFPTCTISVFPGRDRRVPLFGSLQL